MKKNVNSKSYFGHFFDKTFPITFNYDGVPFNFNDKEVEICKTHNSFVGFSTEVYVIKNKDGLTITLTAKYYDEYPAVEWSTRFCNHSGSDTKVINSIKSIDILWEPNKEFISYPEFPILRYSRGSEGRMDDFSLIEEYLNIGQSKEFGATNGVCSDFHLPFFNLKYGGQGLFTAIGWSGNWTCKFDHLNVEARNTVKITAGIDKTNFYLKPDEDVRVPTILLLYWTGNMADSHNLFRRLLVKEYSPNNRQPLKLPISCPTWGGLKTPGHFENIEFIKEKNLPFTCYWIDAGWFGPPHDAEEYQNLATEDWYGIVGDWRVNTVMHPNGLKPISDLAHKNNMDFLLWIEPERAINGTPITKEHPEWCLSLPESIPRPAAGKYPSVDALFFDYSNPEALQWMIDYLCDTFKKEGVDVYRQDMNTNPMPYWNYYEAPDRIGIYQMKHIEGLYQLYDALLKRNPNLLIDNCCGGGKRIDIETCKRSVPLHRSDYTVHFEADPIGGQSQSHGIMHWVPYSGMGSLLKDGDTYQFRSEMNACLALSVRRAGGRNLEDNQLKVGVDDSISWNWHKKMMEQHSRICDMFSGDFYPLVKFDLSEKLWYAYQLDRSDLTSGMVLFFRRSECPNDTITLKLFGLDENATYSFENIDTGKISNYSGSGLLATGLTVTILNKRESALFIYHKTD